jgi:hypothetical protein
LGHVGHADFHLERRGHAIEGLEPAALRILGVLMQVDEAGCEGETVHIDAALALERLRGNFHDPIARDADVADGIEAGLGIHHVPG